MERGYAQEISYIPVRESDTRTFVGFYQEKSADSGLAPPKTFEESKNPPKEDSEAGLLV